MGEGEGTGPHDEVVSSLLDLQARLRGDEPPQAPDEREKPQSPDDILVVPEPEATADPPVAEERAEFASVTSLRTATAGEDRLRSLTERISTLESSLSSVSG